MTFQFQLDGAAPERYERYVSRIMAPFVEALLDSVGIAPGMAVLDVACGTGLVARAAAKRLEGTGRLIGLDINAGMLEVAAAVSEGSPIEWHEASADALPFPAGSFDAVLCQQGIQFFPDRAAAVAEAARVTRPGGRVSVTFWSPLSRSPYFEAQYRVATSILGPGGVDGFMGAFECSPQAMADHFEAVGMIDVRQEEIVAPVHLPSVDDFIPGHLTAIPWGIAVAEAGALEAASVAILEEIAPHREGDDAIVPFASFMVTGIVS